MSNYPPGVTGFEPQIAGTRSGGSAVIDGYHWHDGSETVEEGQFEGEVEAEIEFGTSEVYYIWTCPVCSEEVTTETDGSEYEPDPDADRDDY